jgi:phage baseplate assembly protein gpV
MQGQNISVVPGAMNILLAAAVLTASGQALSIETVTEILLSAAALQMEGQALILEPGAISILLAAAALSISGQSLTIVGGSIPGGASGSDAASHAATGSDAALHVAAGSDALSIYAAIGADSNNG